MTPTLLDLKAGRQFLSGRFLISVDTTEKRIAFTFDDGPNPRNTPRLLEMLARKDIPATFFLVGRNIKRFPELAGEIVAAGHDVGNHTYNHIPLTLLPDAGIRRELRRTDGLIQMITGSGAPFVRPPMGWFSNRVLQIFREMNYCPVLGNIYPKDSSRPGKRAIVDRVLQRIEPGSIVILHDGGWHSHVDRGQTLDAVDSITDQLGEDGYGFDKLSDLMQLSR